MHDGVRLTFDGYPMEHIAQKLETQINIGSYEEDPWEIVEPGWPEPMAAAAFYGLTGEIIQKIEPTTEADRASLLSQLLVGFGNLVGHGPHFYCESTRHALNLFAVLVGRTSKSRKGTSWERVRRLLAGADSEWESERVSTGLSSGEGLIEAVRDPDDAGNHGVDDKRQLVQQGEFSSVLKVMNREGNILSAVIRDVWDSGRLRVMTRKNNALHATDAHVSIIGHITRDELRRHLNETEQCNGFANRFLWFAVTRSKMLPHGGVIDPEIIGGLSEKLKRAATFARGAGSRQDMRRNDDANHMWAKVYPELSEGRDGLLGAVISRAEAQTVRLSCIYALLDCSILIRAEHMAAALAVWRFCEDSCRHIFGGRLGDPIADEILEALRSAPEGLSRTDINNLLRRNKEASRINTALTVLRELGKVRSEKRQTEGRPVEMWFAVEVTK